MLFTLLSKLAKKDFVFPDRDIPGLLPALRYIHEANAPAELWSRIVAHAPEKERSKILHRELEHLLKNQGHSQFMSIFDLVRKQHPSVIGEVIYQNGFSLFHAASQQGAAEIVKALGETAQGLGGKWLRKMLESSGPLSTRGRRQENDDEPNAYMAGQNAGSIEAARELTVLASKAGCLTEMLRANHYAFYCRLKEGDPSELIRLVTAAGHSRSMLAAKNYEPFRNACNHENISGANAFIKAAKEIKCDKQMLEAENFSAFHQAVLSGGMDVMERLIELAREHHCLRKMLAAEGYRAFAIAFVRGFTDKSDRLIELAKEVGALSKSGDETIKLMLQGSNFSALHGSIKAKNIQHVLKVIDLLKEYKLLDTALANANPGDGYHVMANQVVEILSSHGQKEALDEVMAHVPTDLRKSFLQKQLVRDALQGKMPRKDVSDPPKNTHDTYWPHMGDMPEDQEELMQQLGGMMARSEEEANPPRQVLWFKGDVPGEITDPLSEQHWQGLPVDKMQEALERCHDWKTTARMDPPHPSLAELPAFGFKKKLYDELLPIMKTASEIEDNTTPELHAYKLATLFSNKEEAERYLDKYLKEWQERDEKQPIHDALLFKFPKKGNWSLPQWKSIILKYGPLVSQNLANAPAIESWLARHEKPFPTTPAQMDNVAVQIGYKRSDENPDFARLANRHGVSETTFNRILDEMQYNSKKIDHLPDLIIDGADIGVPNFYLEKLKPNDPAGYILGELTNCCQSIDGQGAGCAKHGMTSAYGGFYVWKHKTKGRRTDYDRILAQCWGWISKDDALVLDSFERLGPKYDELVEPFVEQLAFEVAGKHAFKHHSKDTVIKSVKLGQGGNTPNLDYGDARTSYPIDRELYNDSRNQYAVPPANHKGKDKDHAVDARDRGDASAGRA